MTTANKFQLTCGVIGLALVSALVAWQYDKPEQGSKPDRRISVAPRPGSKPGTIAPGGDAVADRVDSIYSDLATIVSTMPAVIDQAAQPKWADEPTLPINETLVLPVPETVPVQIGRGFNSLTGQILAPCVEAAADQISSLTNANGGQRVFSNLKAITTLETLYSMWKIDSSAAFDYGVWKGNSRVKYATSQAASRFDNFLAISVDVQNKTESLRRFVLTSDAKAALARGPTDFQQKCGDYFIASRTTGGRFDAIARMNTETVKEESSLHFEGGGSYAGIKGDLSFDQEFKRTFNTRIRNVTILRDGGEEPLPTQSLDALERQAMEFPPKVTIASGKDWPTAVAAVPLWLAEGVEAKNVINLKPARTFVNQLASLKLQMQELRDAADFALANPYQFAPFDSGKVREFKSQLVTLLPKIDHAARVCFESLPSASRCQTWTPLRVPTFAFPTRILEARVYVGVDAANNALLGSGTPFFGGNAKLLGFTFTSSNQRIYVGQIAPCVPGMLFDFSATRCAAPIGFLSDDAEGGLNIPIYRGLIENINQGRLSPDQTFKLKVVGNNQYDMTKSGPGYHAKDWRDISSLAGYLRRKPS